METVGFVLHLVVTVWYVCNAAAILDDKSTTLSSHEVGVDNLDTSLPSIKLSLKQPFPLNNLRNCNENEEKGPLNSLSGGLLPSLLSVLSKSHSFMSKGSNGYDNKCEHDQRSPTTNMRNYKSGSENVDSQTLDSLINNELSGLDANIKVLARKDKGETYTDPGSKGLLVDNYATDFEENSQYGSTNDEDSLSKSVIRRYKDKNNFDVNTSEGPLLNGDDDLLSSNVQDNNFYGQTGETRGSILVENANISSRTNQENNYDEQTDESNGSLVDADVDVLSSDNEENNSNLKDNQIEGPFVDGDVLSSDNEENNSNLKDNQIEGILVNDDVDALNRCNTESDCDGQTTESKGPLVNADVDALSRCNTESDCDDQTTESKGPLVNVDVDVLSRCNTEGDCDGQNTESEGSLVDADIDILSGNNEENCCDEQTNESGGSLLDIDADILSSEEPLVSDTLGGVLGRFVLNDEGFTNNIVNSNAVDSKKEDIHNLDINKENSNIVKNTTKQTSGNKEKNYLNNQRSPSNYFSTGGHSYDNKYQLTMHDMDNENDFTEAVTMENYNMKPYNRNDGTGTQRLTKNATSDGNHIEELKHPLSTKESIYDSPNKFYLERDDSSTINPTIYRIWPLMFQYQLYPERYINKQITLMRNSQGGNVHNNAPKSQYLSQRAIPSKRFFLPFSILPQTQYPAIPQFPQSVAGSSLYGSYARAETFPSYGGVGGGEVEEGTETSVGSSGTIEESSQTTIESSETSVAGDETSV